MGGRGTRRTADGLALAPAWLARREPAAGHRLTTGAANCGPTPASSRQTLDPPFSVHVLIVDAGIRQPMLEKPNKDGSAMMRILRYRLAPRPWTGCARRSSSRASGDTTHALPPRQLAQSGRRSRDPRRRGVDRRLGDHPNRPRRNPAGLRRGPAPRGDDRVIERKVFARLAHIVPAAIVYYGIGPVLGVTPAEAAAGTESAGLIMAWTFARTPLGRRHRDGRSRGLQRLPRRGQRHLRGGLRAVSLASR